MPEFPETYGFSGKIFDDFSDFSVFGG